MASIPILVPRLLRLKVFTAFKSGAAVILNVKGFNRDLALKPFFLGLTGLLTIL